MIRWLRVVLRELFGRNVYRDPHGNWAGSVLRDVNRDKAFDKYDWEK